ncbi:MAG: aspartate/glutamate racemase family protein [Acetobacteraceae bacterium]|nr:aspartate/glutamate racemase family protein [Acetobacteraceae bacterium]
MHIGLIGGIGPAATEFYYRALVKLYAQAERRLELTIANADARELVRHLEAGESTAQAAIFAGYIDRLKAGGCAAVALTSMGAHFCIKDLAPISSLPLISGLTALEEYFSAIGIERVGVLGYTRCDGVSLVRPLDRGGGIASRGGTAGGARALHRHGGFGKSDP